jgi:hypothetical protein
MPPDRLWALIGMWMVGEIDEWPGPPRQLELF